MLNYFTNACEKCCDCEPCFYIRPAQRNDPFCIGIKCGVCYLKIQEEVLGDINMVIDDPLLYEVSNFLIKKWAQIMKIKHKKFKPKRKRIAHSKEKDE